MCLAEIESKSTLDVEVVILTSVDLQMTTNAELVWVA